MPERQNPHSEIIVATAHDLLMAPHGRESVELMAPRDGEGMLDTSRIVRAGERRTNLGTVDVEFEGGQVRELALFEVAYTGLENAVHMRRLMAGTALNQVVVASRLGGRYLHRVNEFPGAVGVWDRFGHPANILRDPDTGGIVAAERIGVPQRTNYRGPDISGMGALRPIGETARLVNYLPEDMYLLSDEEPLHVANCGQVADVNYDYEPIGETAAGIMIAASTPAEVVGMPEKPARHELRLVHTEVLFEALRLGVASPEEASRMVVACGVGRMAGGQQGNTFTSLACYSVETLQEIYRRIRV